MPITQTAKNVGYEFTAPASACDGSETIFSRAREIFQAWPKWKQDVVLTKYDANQTGRTKDDGKRQKHVSQRDS